MCYIENNTFSKVQSPISMDIPEDYLHIPDHYMNISDEYLNIPDDDLDLPFEMPPSGLVCGLCAEYILDDEDVHVLECGCCHHLYCLLDEFELLQTCPMCETPIDDYDIFFLEDAYIFIQNDE
ncbi:hypothetical protein HNY73_001049 [Argiope bruennichi]|uniref:RING-type domain-containing protein n=1 Tax=Argiope bruennichi TaxID=94029 RepID=A0A8T0G643_ARGBR|nr:hypothetical protein HNY73_001049 [Argiope bruennichi]